MSNTLKISGPIKVGSFASDPAGAENGFIYFNTTDGNFKLYQGGSFSTIVDQSIIDNLVATDIAYERADGSKKNIQGTSDDVENALTDLDDAIGALDATPTNYTPSNAAIVADHLAAIDSALITSGSDEKSDATFRIKDDGDATKKIAFQASGITTSTVRTITMPDSDVNLGDIATNSAKVSADGSVTSHSDVTDAGSGAIITTTERSKLDGIESGATADQTGAEIKAAYEAEADTNAFTDAEKTKLAGIEALADVTDATNVAAAGAVMESDTSTALMSFVIDEDNMVSDSDTKVPTQQSVKAYVDSAIAGGVSYEGGYNASTNTPDLDSAPSGIIKGDMYTVTVAGTFFSADVEPGDVLIAEIDNAAVEANWTIVQSNLTPSSIKSQYESNADTNAFTDAEKTLLGNQSGTNTGDEVAASDTVLGIVELATLAETDAGTDATRAVTPAGLTNILSDISGKLSNVSEDTTPSLGGDLEVGANAIEGAANDILLAGQDSVKRAKQASKSSFIEEEYLHSTSLSGSQTNTVISDLTFAHASIEGMEICYKLKEATSGDIKIGTMRIVTNGTTVVLNDMGTETADTGITFSAAINGANVEVRYSSGTNGGTLRADIKRFQA